MGSIFDELGAVLIAGAVMMLVLALNALFVTGVYQGNLRAVNQENLSGADTLGGLARIIERDFSQIGRDASPAFILADSNRVTCEGDIDSNGIVDSIKYYLIPVTPLPNGNARLTSQLCRRQNAEAVPTGVGVSTFRLTFFDSRGRTLPCPVANSSLGQIRSIRVQLQLESAIRVTSEADSSFASLYWERRISPRNLRSVK